MIFKSKAEKKAFRAGCSTGYRKATNSCGNKQVKSAKKVKKDVYYLSSEGNRPLTLSQRHNILMRDSDSYSDIFHYTSRGDYAIGSEEHLKKAFDLYLKSMKKKK